MRNSRADVVAAALRVLDEHGLEFCSMRRVAAELGVQPSALYHHVPDKQTLLALMADEIVRDVGSTRISVEQSRTAVTTAAHGAERGVRDVGSTRISVEDPGAICGQLRDAVLAVRDGADVVATASAFRLGASRIERELAGLVGADGARTLLLYTFGHAQSTQTQLQAAEFAALTDPSRAADSGTGARPATGADAELEASFRRGIEIILAGLGAEGR